MNSWTSLIVLAAVAASACAQYYGHDGQYHHGHHKQPPAAILSHKQALGHDGSFKYSFAADNGLQQGESIAPDGSRIGSYSYVDPHGKTIAVHYKADKNGFHVQGDHLPKSVQPIHPQPNTPHHYHQQAPQHYNGNHGGQYDDGSYNPQHHLAYETAASNYDDGSYNPQHHLAYEGNNYDDGSYNPQHHLAYQGAASNDYNNGNNYNHGNNYNNQYNPNKFGQGYAFQIGG